MSNENLIRPIELAKTLGVTTKTLTTWRKQGTGPKFVRMVGTIRYRKVDVESYLDKNTTQKREP